MYRKSVSRVAPRRVSRKSYGKQYAPRTAVVRYPPRNIAMRGNQLDQGEFKSVDVAVGVACDTTGTLTLLNGIARGDDIMERTGREVLMKSIEVTYQCNVTTTTGIDQRQRLLIVYDRQANGSALTIAQVLAVVNTTSHRNLENRKRFKIIYDQQFALNAAGESGSTSVGKYYRKLSHPVTFNSGDAGTVADITTGSMYAISVGSVAAGATAGTQLIDCRIRYLDK